MLAPRCDRIVHVEPHAELDGLPEPLQVGLAEHLLRPAGVRDADDGPVVQLLVDLTAVLLGELEHPRAADAVAGQVREQVRLGITRQRDDGGPFRPDLLGAVQQPRRRPGEHTVGRTFDQGTADVLVAVEHVDVARSCLVGRSRDCARNTGVLDAPDDVDELTRLHVRADPYGELGVPLDPSGLVRELPYVLTQDRHRFAVGGEAVDLQLGTANHEVGMDVRDVHVVARISVEGVRDAEAVGDVAGGVLVEQRVVERDAGLADTRRAVDERELTEVDGTLVAVELAAHELRAVGRIHLDDSTVRGRSA